MSETPAEIQKEVKQVQRRLAQDLNALDHRVKTVTDWRWQFRQHPWPVLAAAFGVALIVGFTSVSACRRD